MAFVFVMIGMLTISPLMIGARSSILLLLWCNVFEMFDFTRLCLEGCISDVNEGVQLRRCKNIFLENKISCISSS